LFSTAEIIDEPAFLTAKKCIEAMWHLMAYIDKMCYRHTARHQMIGDK
jgi:hypothetical protein